MFPAYFTCVGWVRVSELWVGIYSIIEECVGHWSDWGRGTPQREGERERGRNSGSWFVSVSSKQRAYSTRLVSHALTHTCAHTLTDERTVYSDQQRVCSEAGSRKLTD